MNRIFVALVVLSTVACGASPHSPSNFDFAGTWSGTVNDATMGRGTLRLVITATDLGVLRDVTSSNLKGTWTVTFSGASKSGSVDGGGYTDGARAWTSIILTSTTRLVCEDAVFVSSPSTNKTRIVADYERVAAIAQQGCAFIIFSTGNVSLTKQ